jgi:hypothetical protein
MNACAYNLLSPPTILTIKKSQITYIINKITSKIMQKKDLMTVIEKKDGFSAEVSACRMGLEEGKTYVAHILGGTKNEYGSEGNKVRGLVIAASPLTDTFDVETADFFVATVGNNAFAGNAKLRTVEEKKAAIADENAFFTVKWNYQTDARNRVVVRDTPDGKGTYNPKEWESGIYKK